MGFPGKLPIFQSSVWTMLVAGGLGMAVIVGMAGTASAVTQYQPVRKPFLFDITTFTTTLNLPVTEVTETVRMSDMSIEKRLARYKQDETVEPLSVLLSNSETQIMAIAEKIAKQGRIDEVADYLRKELVTSKPIKPGAATKTVVISREAWERIDADAFVDMFSKTHHNLTVKTREIKEDKALRRELMAQLSPFFSKRERKKILASIMRGDPLPVDERLLPEFPRKMVKKYIAYRGPNCFHAALAFHSPRMTSSSLLNVKDETGYHRAMINYDELWRVLQQNFYEIDPDRNPLKYGDMMVFFDVPAESENRLDEPVDFKWIRHTATYLFGGYTFSKGSKSPNTPYTVRTLSDEWKTWKRYTKNLGVKVFRRTSKTVQAQPPLDLTDWIY